MNATDSMLQAASPLSLNGMAVSAILEHVSDRFWLQCQESARLKSECDRLATLLDQALARAEGAEAELRELREQSNRRQE